MSEYIRKRKIDTNECPNIYSWPIYSNIQIFEYIRHTLLWAPDIWIVGVGEKNLPVGHLVVDVPPSEGPVEVGEGVLDPFLHFLREFTSGVVVQ